MNSSFEGTYRSTGNSFIPNYNNLPPGISNAGGGEYSAYVGTVQPDQLVSNQLQGLLSSGSPYMQQARQQGYNTANARGMLNSSMAAGNAQAAAIQAGLPIAQADASTYSTQQLSNQQHLNQVLQSRMSADAQTRAANASASAATAAAEIAARNALIRQREQLAFQGEQQGLDRNQQILMNQLGYGNQMGILGQQYQHGLGTTAFNAANQMMMANQGFRYNAGMQAMNNPSFMQNPEAFGGWMNFIGGDYNNTINNLLSYAFGGGM